MEKYNSVDEYIAAAASEVRPKLEQFRRIIKDIAPTAEERISYGMPGYYLRGPLAYFGAFKNHVSLFATASKGVREKFEAELRQFKTSKGTIQFPLNQPLPEKLIKDIINLRVEENSTNT